MKINSFDNIIKEKVAAHEAPVPADAWDNIKKEKKKRPGMFWWAFAALFIGFSLFGVYQMKNRQSTALTAAKPAGEKNTATEKKRIIISESSDIDIQQELPAVTDSIQHNIPVSKSKTNTTIIPADEGLPDTDNNDLKKTKSARPSLNKNPGHLNKNKNAKKYNNIADITTTTGAVTVKKKTIKPGKSEWQYTGKDDVANTAFTKPASNKKARSLNKYGKKDNTTDEIINGTDVVTAKIKTKKTGIHKEDNKEELWADAKNKKTFRGKTNIKITAPATHAAGENERADTTAIAAAKKIKPVEPADSSTGSLSNTPELAVKKPLVNTDSTIKPGTAKTKQSKRKFFVDIGIMPFVPVQTNAALLNIKRTTVNSLSRSEFTADEIRTTVNASFSYNIGLRKKLAANWYAGVGLQYTQMKETTRLSGKETNTRLSVVKRLDNTGLFLVDDTVATVTNGKRIIDATNSYEFISIPVFAQYSLWEKKAWSLSLNGGLIFNVKSTYKNSIEGSLMPAYSSAGMENKKVRKLTTDFFASMRLSKVVAKNYKLYIEPGFQFNLQKFNMQNMINYKNIHRAGLTVGFTYQVNY